MDERHEIPELLQFRPKWWWDPVPDWIIRHLEREQLIQLATVQLEVQRGILNQQLEAIEKTMGILQRRQ